eukprot:TRINITY_DN14614_c0_g1_i2.p1 TRINITY_DN14614_c0_g1~~TRINITY_DN14614_c0_g1_i2.p1  ORF type:complete len:236 (+),score=35.17 TRINITY_DN14614_c0_g1_i2:74-709(+)
MAGSIRHAAQLDTLPLDRTLGKLPRGLLKSLCPASTSSSTMGTMSTLGCSTLQAAGLPGKAATNKAPFALCDTATMPMQGRGGLRHARAAAAPWQIQTHSGPSVRFRGSCSIASFHAIDQSASPEAHLSSWTDRSRLDRTMDPRSSVRDGSHSRHTGSVGFGKDRHSSAPPIFKACGGSNTPMAGKASLSGKEHLRLEASLPGAAVVQRRR